MNNGSPSPYVSRVSLGRHPLWKGGRPLLGHLDMELTERCNNNCIHCCVNLPSQDIKAKQRELRTPEIQDILTEAAALGSLSVRFTGGEPLLREDFIDLYLFARRLGLKVLLFTNARLITPELADLFSRIPPLKQVEVTIYGMRQESYEAVTRVPGSYQEFRRGLDLLLERNIPFLVKGSLLPPNRKEMDAFEAWAATLPAQDGAPSYAMFLDLRSRRDSPAKNRRIKSLRLSPEEAVAALKRFGESFFKGIQEFCSKFMGPQGDRLFSCSAGRAVCVDAYGALQPCMSLRHPDTVYNLQGGSLRDALVNFFPKLRETKIRNPKYLARCARCFLRGLCQQCPAKSWGEHGTLDTPVEYFCRVAQAKARDLGLLRDGEHPWEVENWKERILQI